MEVGCVEKSKTGGGARELPGTPRELHVIAFYIHESILLSPFSLRLLGVSSSLASVLHLFFSRFVYSEGGLATEIADASHKPALRLFVGCGDFLSYSWSKSLIFW